MKYMYCELKNIYDEDMDSWKFKLKCYIPHEHDDEADEIGYCKGLYLKDVWHRGKEYLFDVLDEHSQDTYELYEEIENMVDEISDICLIDKLFINEDYRGNGFGKEAIEYLKKAFNGSEFYVWPSDFTSENKNEKKLTSYYRKNGFKKFGKKYMRFVK